jgi:hypothetical protein
VDISSFLQTGRSLPPVQLLHDFGEFAEQFGRPLSGLIELVGEHGDE